MKRRKPHYPLDEVKRLVGCGQCMLVEAAKRTAHSLGFSESEAMNAVARLERKDFFKSETDFYGNISWQDYYSKRVKGIDVFIKPKISRVGNDFVLVLSFKKDESAGGVL